MVVVNAFQSTSLYSIPNTARGRLSVFPVGGPHSHDRMKAIRDDGAMGRAKTARDLFGPVLAASARSERSSGWICSARLSEAKGQGAVVRIRWTDRHRSAIAVNRLPFRGSSHPEAQSRRRPGTGHHARRPVTGPKPACCYDPRSLSGQDVHLTQHISQVHP